MQERYARHTLFTTCVMSFTYLGLCWNCLSVFADAIIKDWSITRAQFMLVFSIMSLVNAVTNITVFGKLHSKLGSKRFVTIFAGIQMASFVIMAISQNIYMLYLGGFVYGVGMTGVNMTTVNVILGEWYKDSVGSKVTFVATVANLLSMVFSVIYSSLILAFGWRFPMWITAGFMVVSFITVRVLYKGSPDEVGVVLKSVNPKGKEGREEESTLTGLPFKETLKTSPYITLLICYFIYPIVFQGMLSNLPVLAVDLGYESISGVINGVALFAMAAFFIPAGIIMDKIGTKWLLLLCAILIGTSMIILRFTHPGTILIFIVAALIGISSDAFAAFGVSTKEAVGDFEFSKKIAPVGGFCYIGQALGPVIMGSIFDHTGSYNMAYVLFLGIAVVSVALIFYSTKNRL